MKSKFLVFFASAFLATTFLSGCDFASHDGERHEVVFKNYDQTVLYTNTVEYGGTAEYQGPVPTRPSFENTAYYFTGWDRPLENIKKDTEFIAQYDTTPNMIKITWKNYDGKEITTSETVYAQTPAYVGELPERPDDENCFYTFKGWSPEIVPATEPATYTAVYEEHDLSEKTGQNMNLTIYYTIHNPKTGELISSSATVPTGLGSVSQSGTYTRGQDIDLYAHPREGYTFIGWFYKDHQLSNQEDYLLRGWNTDARLEARFQYTLYTFTAKSSNYSFGRVAVNNASYSGSSSQRMYYTEEITVYSNSTDDIRFIGWYNEQNALQSNNGAYTFAMPNKDLKLTAKWNKFFVTYNLNGGNVDESLLEDSYSYLSATDRYIILPTPTRTGYNFLGWYANYNEQQDVLVTRLDKSQLCDYQVYARWEAITYTVIYYGNGSTGGSTSSQTMTYDVYYTVKTNGYSRRGYSFLYWNTRADGQGTTYNPGDYVSNLTTVSKGTFALYAIWEANTYTATTHSTYDSTVYFETNGANETLTSQKVTASNPLRYPGNLTKPGYAFKGWFSDEACTLPFNFGTTIYHSMVLYAGWETMSQATASSVQYVDAQTYNSSSYYYSASQSATNSSSCNYYYFTPTANATANIYYRTSSSSSSYYVYFSIFNVTEGTTVRSFSYISNTSFSYYSFTAYAGNVYYIATYRYNTSYSPTFSFYFAGGAFSSANESSVEVSSRTHDIEYDSEYTLYPNGSNMSRNGYTFDGWYDASGKKYADADGTCVATWNDIESKHLYPKWIPIEYSISYEPNGGTNPDDNPTKYTVDDYLQLKAPTKEGYSFDGWYLDEEFNTKVTSIANGAYYSDLTLYAKWSAKQFKVTLNCNGGTLGKSEFTVSFDLNGASGSIDSQTIDSETGLVYPTNPSRSGYVFAGWYTTSGCVTPFDFTDEVTGDTTVYAKWISCSGSATAINYGNNTINIIGGGVDQFFAFYALTTTTITINVGKNAWIGANTSASESGSHAYNTITYSVTAGNTYYIHLESNSNSSASEYVGSTYLNIVGSITPEAGGKADEIDSSTAKAQVTYNEEYTLKVPVRNGYTFKGWYKEDVQYTDKDGKCLAKWTDLEDTTLTAKWEINTYSITYHLNGGTNDEENPETYDVEDDIILQDPERAGYSFAGWYLESTFDTLVTLISDANYYRDLDLYAKWEANKYVLTLEPNGGSVSSFTVKFVTNGADTQPEPQVVDEYTPLHNPGTLTKSGYAFAGWFSDEECTQVFDFSANVTKDTTVYAGWKEMVTSGYNYRNYIQANYYNNSSNYYSVSQSSTSSSAYNYHYFTAYKSETVSFYYRNYTSSSTSYRIYFMMYDVTAGSTVISNSGCTNTSFYSMSISLTAGHVYYLRTYRYNSSYSPTFNFYFYNMSGPTDGGLFDPSETLTLTKEVTYDSDYTLPTNIQRDGYKFLGWFDEEGNQYTDEYGKSLLPWKTTNGMTLYAHWEAL